MLGDNIRKYRKLNNMSQDELAEKLNVTRQSISLWETGQTQPSLENIVALAKLFKVSTDELLVSDKNVTPAQNTAASQKPNDPQNKTKLLFLILGVVIAVVLLVAGAFVLLGTDNDPENDDGTADTQTATSNTENNTQEDTNTENNTSNTEDLENEKDIFGYLKQFVIENGTINGDYCYYSKSADNYGGYASESFSLYYWGDTNKIEFCLHSVLDETFSINFYLYVPEEHNGKYEYISSYYYRDTGEPLYEARGTIDAEEFTDNYPLNCTDYFGSTDKQNTFMEMSRQGICDLIDCLGEFIEVENIQYSFEDFGFLKFKLD
jgi:transcriptional regulator with XRE-family HTH domain